MQPVFHKVLLLLPLLSFFNAAVADEKSDFAHDIGPLLKKNCGECHTGDRSEGGFSFNTQRQLERSGYVEPGKPDSSRLIELVLSTDPADQMPPRDRPRLSMSETNLLKKWVAAGAPWEPGFRFAATGYEPPLLPGVVELPAPAFPGENPIDRILRPYLEANKVQPLELADDDVFLRRVYMDLIGLLPTAEEREDFQNDPRMDRRARLIDGLLQRDRDYAEHWIVFWNDLLRNDYAGTGYIDGGRKQITEWLYGSLVDNKPYDQFVRELIAPKPEAEGFINGIKWRGDVNASQVTEIQFAQNVSQVFLGINMKCASCHDSFIDRWTLDEAYHLAAIYSNRPLEIHRCDKATGRMATPAWIFPEIGNINPESSQPERLQQLAGLLTSPRNGRFARTIVNRLWHRLMGHGIVHPVDAMHTPPWSSELLEYLAASLVDQKYDLKRVLSLIATSGAYQSVAEAAEDSAASDEFVFRGPIARHLTAEQFMDGVWQLTRTTPPSIQAPLPHKLYFGDLLPEVSVQGQWIWKYAETQSSPAGEQVSFLKRIELSQKPHSAKLVLTCDNEYTVYINGRKAGADGNHSTLESLNIQKDLKVGENELVIVGRNAGNDPNPAGLFAEVLLTDADGNKSRIATDATWLVHSDYNPETPVSSVEWTMASVVAKSALPEPAADSSFQAQLAIELHEVRRNGRAALLKSDMLMRSLGRPNREQVVTTRPESMSTLQAIDLANGEILNNILLSAATRFASGNVESEPLVQQLFLQALSRAPSATEQKLCESILGTSPTADSIQDLLWLLIMLPEFQFVQ